MRLRTRLHGGWLRSLPVSANPSIRPSRYPAFPYHSMVARERFFVFRVVSVLAVVAGSIHLPAPSRFRTLSLI